MHRTPYPHPPLAPVSHSVQTSLFRVHRHAASHTPTRRQIKAATCGGSWCPAWRRGRGCCGCPPTPSRPSAPHRSRVAVSGYYSSASLGPASNTAREHTWISTQCTSVACAWTEGRVVVQTYNVPGTTVHVGGSVAEKVAVGQHACSCENVCG